MKLKSSSKVNKRRHKNKEDKELKGIPMRRKNSNELTDEEVSQGPSDLLKKNK